jgi:hypothetical protein
MPIKCEHDVNWLMGTNAGIVCRKCGKLFPDFATLGADLEADRKAQEQPAEEKPKPKKRKKKADEV